MFKVLGKIINYVKLNCETSSRIDADTNQLVSHAKLLELNQ